MTKILYIFIVYFAAMFSFLIFLDLLVGIPLNVSINAVFNPFAVTAPGELVILTVLAIAAFAVPAKYYLTSFIKKLRNNN